MLSILTRTGGSLKKYLPSCTEDFGTFKSWMEKLRDSYVQHDLETTVDDSVLNREILVATYTFAQDTWVLFVPELTKGEFKDLLGIMALGKFTIQNVKFEYQMWKKHGVILNRFHDTYLTEKILTMGLDGTDHSLAGIVFKYTSKHLSKDLQKSFVSTSAITDDQLEYSVYDVALLNAIKDVQESEIKVHDIKFKSLIKHTDKKNRGLKKANWWTNEFIKVLSDIEFKGIILNKDKWQTLYDKALPLVRAAEMTLNNVVKRDFYTRAVASGFIYDKDTPCDKLFTSASKKLKLLNLIFPDIKEVAGDRLRQYLQSNDPDWPKEAVSHNSKKAANYLGTYKENLFTVLKLILANNTGSVWKFFSSNYRDDLISLGLMYPKDSVDINWASPVQRMEIFKWIVPNLESTDKEHMEEVAYKHMLLSTYLEDYQGAIGKITKFGLGYFKHIENDGRIRTYIDPVLNTGRISSSKPNILNIINDPEYRAAFEPAPGYKFIMSDYQSEELVLTAFMSKEPVWLDALSKGQDLHSVNGSRIFPVLWEKAKEEGCRFDIDSSRCKCKGHNKLRSRAKTSGFGIIYGITKFGLAWKLKDTEQAAQDTIDSFYSTYPKIQEYFRHIGKFSLDNGYTPEAGFGTARFFDKKKIHYAKESILRTSGNFTIQGLGAAILKVCTVLIRRHIRSMGHDAHIVLIPYDEVIMEVHETIADYWQIKLKYFMELAGRLVLGVSLLKADEPKIGDYWIH